jgi:hypothetical protein
LDAVGDDQVGVQRVTLPRCPVVEPDRQHSLGGHVLDTTMTTAGAEVLVQVADRLGQPGVVGGQYRPTGGSLRQAVEDRHAFGRPQHHVKAGHGVVAMGPAQQLASRRVSTFEHGLESRWRCFALQAEGGGAGAVPPARGLAVAGQIRLVVGGQLAGVILLPPYRQFRDVGHHPAPASRLRWRQQRTRGALLSSDEFRVERRANGEGSSVMTDRN